MVVSSGITAVLACVSALVDHVALRLASFPRTLLASHSRLALDDVSVVKTVSLGDMRRSDESPICAQ